MICVYNKNNTEFTKNGDAVLIPLSATLEMTINGTWQLKLSHPYDPEGRYKLLVEGNIIRADIRCIRELEATRQLFRIYYFMRDTSAVEIIAFPVAMEANFDAPIDNIVIENKTGIEAMAALQNKIGSGKYTLQTDITRTGSTSLANTNIHTALAGSGENSFLKVWGGELIYDNFKFKVRNRVGDNTAADHKIQYGNNLTNIEYKKDDSGVTTRIYPISQDGIRLNGSGYVDSPNHFSDYPVAHCRHLTAPYTLVDTNPTSPTSTAAKTRQAVAAVTAQAQTDINTGVTNATGAGIPPEYIKSIRQNITEAVKTAALSAVYSSSLYAALGAAIEAGAAGLAELEQPEWGWMGSDETGWKYGNADSYARNQYIKIGKKWSYFGDDGNWQEPRDDSAAWDWHQESGTLKRYGNFEKYYAHNEFIYITESGTLKEYWFNDQGWYESDESGDSDWAWHGSGTAADPWWFGEEGASASDTRKYAHDCWLFIDGTLYFFDSYGYYDGSTKFENYQWDWVKSDERFWFGNDADHSFAAVYLKSQWAKINGAWYYFDANGYVETTNDSIERAVAYFTGAITGTTSTVNSWRDQLYTLLYNNMTAWALRKYSQERVDLPVITISVFTVDLSKTTEYKGFEHLQTIKLGDSVECTDAVHGISTTNRVVGIVYDIIKDYNEEVVIGSAAATVGQILGSGSGQAVAGGFDTSALEAQISATQTSLGTLQRTKQNKLTAGENITIENDVISAAGGGGLQYWIETTNKFYREGTHAGISGLANYLRSGTNEIGYYLNGAGMFNCYVIRLKNAPDKVIEGICFAGLKGLYVFASPEGPLDYEWGYSDNTYTPPYGVTEWKNKESYPPYIYHYEYHSDNYPVGSRNITVTYEGTTWYVLLVECAFWEGGDDYSAVETVNSFNYWWGGTEEQINGAGHALLEAAHARPYTNITTEIGTENYAFKYGGKDETYASIDTDGNALVKEITTDAGTLTSQMAQKQNVLTAGANVSINNNTISATDTTYNDFAGSIHGLVPPVTTQSGKFLKDDGTWDTPSGGGSSVIANPSGTPTDTLQTVEIDGTIYEIEGGAGGGSSTPNIDWSSMTWNLLLTQQGGSWSTATAIPTGTNYLIVAIDYQGHFYTPQTLDLKELNKLCQEGNKDGVRDGFSWRVDNDYDTIEYIYDYDNQTIAADAGYSGLNVKVYALSGGGSGGGGSSYTEDILYINSGTTAGDITLAHAYTDYDALYFDIRREADNTNYQVPYMYLTSEMVIGENLQVFGYNEYISYDITSSTALTKLNNNGSWYVYKVIGVKFGGGSGGGNTITYGTIIPTSSANDGDLYFLLSGGMKKAEFLYMSNAWSIIDGTIIEEVVLTQSRRNSGAADTYTATEECTVLCINQNMNGEASTKSLTSSIITTGTILYTDEYSVGWSSPERNQCTRVSLIHLEEGETVTLSNSYEGNYTTQLHVVVKISSYITVNQITREASTARADNSYGTSETYSLATAGLYFVIGFQTRGTGGGTTYATISALNNSETYELIRAGANESVSVAMVKHPNTITFAWNNQSDYATKGYAVYKLS